jgi:hypothetical protein
MTPLRKTSVTAGILYIITFFSIPTFTLDGPIHESDFIVGADSNTNVIIGNILELVVALAGIGTAVVLP